MIIAVCKKLDKTQIDTKLAHETCAGNISKTNCLIALVSFVSHSPTCTAGPCALNCYGFLYTSKPRAVNRAGYGSDRPVDRDCHGFLNPYGLTGRV